MKSNTAISNFCVFKGTSAMPTDYDPLNIIPNIYNKNSIQEITNNIWHAKSNLHLQNVCFNVTLFQHKTQINPCIINIQNKLYWLLILTGYSDGQNMEMDIGFKLNEDFIWIGSTNVSIDDDTDAMDQRPLLLAELTEIHRSIHHGT